MMTSIVFMIAKARKDLDNTMANGAQSPKEIAAAVLTTLEQALRKSGPEALVPQLVSLLRQS